MGRGPPVIKLFGTYPMKPVSIMHYTSLWTYITLIEHIYNALYVVMVRVNLAYNYDYTAL